MITYDFEYYKPSSIGEATLLFQSLDQQGKEPIYFSGGTEIITLGRVNRINTGAVIDIKGIPECLALNKEAGKITFGAAQTLTKIREIQYFPFLSKAIVEIADHTARNKITLGGNMCANIIYRETVLPLLLSDSQIVIASPTGLKQVSINEMFDQTLKLQRGELLVQVITDEKEMGLPSLCIKKRKHWDVGYPLITVAALKKNEHIKFAFSGLCSYPFRNENMEKSLNNQELSNEAKIEKAMQHIPAPVLNDVQGSENYRRFVLKNTLLDMLDTIGGAENV
ncbi:FAD binding domain-containing protein [Clostridium formicaceticum]|uniref:Nicotinate dehydrogenase FAD-subunit n=1 Tax=Clostridium formicaceticum TaxID=1497 RepID=A0AAC9RPJ6_9CLOT|nr:FAD binding domain-containing protein [Clostridium formicaceticum]AOY74619.1 xanthine dehydrogenase [Clostridium formicaceticum]ARE88983.1 Nicotinate dehydrogenase FAD-subunit [Clostridium formicaceticum]